MRCVAVLDLQGRVLDSKARVQPIADRAQKAVAIRSVGDHEMRR